MPDRMRPVQAARLTGALLVARSISSALRISGRGGGTASPGLAALKIDPQIVRHVTARLPEGVVVVAGTNGKTTTSRLLAQMLETNGTRVAHNRSGSNLMRGVASALAESASLTGRLNADIAVVEADEAAFSEIVAMTTPRLVVLTNLFRDQLDRYGELDAISRRWKPVLTSLPASSTVVVNADDPNLVALTDDLRARRICFGIDPGMHALSSLPHAADAAICRRCEEALEYEVLSVSHLGKWKCPECGWTRPDPDFEATCIALRGLERLELSVNRVTTGDSLHLSVALPGLYNAYNVTAATASATVLGVGNYAIVRAAESFTAPFGRVERIPILGRTITLGLVKNPVGFNEMLRMLAPAPSGLTIATMIAINDLDADGRDVSWLWDVDFELLAPGRAPLATAGIRGADMANRLKYAGVSQDRLMPLGEQLREALYSFVEHLEPGSEGCVLTTYTAMLDVRKVISDEGLAKAFWEQ
ncbi:MurT ligase domain-containing protein [soil metagenome]